MKIYYKITPVKVIETDIGNFETWCEKRFCRNEYVFLAKQISVKFNGQHIYVENDLKTFRYFTYDTVNITNIDYTTEIPIVKHEIPLNNFRGYLIGNITKYKKAYDYFKFDIIRKNKSLLNE